MCELTQERNLRSLLERAIKKGWSLKVLESMEETNSKVCESLQRFVVGAFDCLILNCWDHVTLIMNLHCST